MKYGTKIIYTENNWLNDISGLTVSEAIDYFKTLDQNLVLSWNLEGDTHGCDIEMHLGIIVDIAFSEYKANLLVKANKQLEDYRKAKLYYENDLIRKLPDAWIKQRKEQIEALEVKIKAQLEKIEVINLRTE